MSSRITIYSRAGLKLCELDTYFRRTWKLNEFGEGELYLSIEDAKVVYEYLKFGNFIYAEHDKLPAWGGVLYTPRDWTRFAFIQIACYSAEYLLKFRSTPKVLKADDPSGAVFSKLIENLYPTEQALPIAVGSIWGGGEPQKITYNFTETYEAVKTLADNTGYEWDITPAVDQLGRLYFNANWYEARGEMRRLRLIEDQNIELNDTPMVEQGDIANYVIGYGEGSSWSTKPISELQNADAINEYGLFAKVFGFEDGKKAQLSGNVQAKVDYYKYPRVSFDLNALDKGNTFYNIRPGDILPLELYSCGFTNGELGYKGSARVMGMTYDEQNNKLELVLNEV